LDKFYRLDYGHEELEVLLDKLNAGKLLTPEEYSYLKEVIGGVQNISTFNGDYNNLNNKPHIPETVEELRDSDSYATVAYLEEKLRAVKENLEQAIISNSYATDNLTSLYDKLDDSLAILDRNLARMVDTQVKLELASYDYATASDFERKADVGHDHKLSDTRGLLEALSEKANHSHNHDESYAAKVYEHIHADIDALNTLTTEKINKWETDLDAADDNIVHLQVDVDWLKNNAITEGDGHTHTNMDVLSKIYIEDVNRWNDANNFDTEGKITTAAVGGIGEGENLTGLTVHHILKRMLYPDKKYEISASIVLDKSGYVFEKGSSVLVKQIKLKIVERGSSKVAEVIFYANNAQAQVLENPDPDNAATEFVYDINQSISDSVNNTFFRVQLKDAMGSLVRANTQAVNFYYPMYFGITNANTIPTESSIKANMTKKVVAKSTQSHAFTMNKQCAVFVYPASYGDLSSIKDPSGFEQMNGFTKHTVTLTGLDNSSQTYNMYIGPSNTNTNFKLTFSF
jgi:hypothetical protein